MPLTPGLRFIFTTLPELIAPPLGLHLCLVYLANTFDAFTLSPTLLLAVWTLTIPISCYIKASIIQYLHSREAKRLGAKLIPQVKGKLPGNIDLIWTNFGDSLYLGDPWAQAIDTHGTTFANTVLGVMAVVTANPENMKQILATEFNQYEKGPKFNKITGSVLGEGVFNSDGEMWQFHRKLTRPFFAKERVTNFFDIFDAKSSVALQKMEERFAQGHAIDFQDISSRFTIDSACEFLLGVSIHSLHDPLPEPGVDFSAISTPSNRFFRAFSNAQISISTRGRMGVAWPLVEIFKDRTKDDMREVRGFIEPIVREAMRKRTGGFQCEKHDSLLQHLAEVTQNMKLIVDETINIMLAGRDTTASLLTFITYCLALHPEVLVRLREEIMNTVGTSRAPTYDDIRGMKYLRAVLNETLRLFPSVPFNNRNTIAATTLVDEEGNKFYVPPKTRVVFSSLLSQRHKPYWGVDAHLFDPDRFLDERIKRITENPYTFIPFSAGPRICLGQQFAYHEVSCFVIRMLQRYDRIMLAPECQPESSHPPSTWRHNTSRGSPRKPLEQCVIKSHLTMYSDGGLWLRMGRSKEMEEV